jgi:hypothetical protein
MTTSRLACLACLLAGCSTKSASFFATSQMNCDASATSTDGATTSVRVSFTDQTLLQFLQLTASDHLQVTVGSETHVLDEVSVLGAVDYQATFSQAPANVPFLISLSRTSDLSAPATVIELPEAMTLSAGSTHARSQDATFTWTGAASSDSTTIDISGGCVQGYSTAVPSGATQFTLPAGSLTKSSGGSDSCQATIVLTRARGGTLDSHYRGGSAQGVQSRSANFTTTP